MVPPKAREAACKGELVEHHVRHVRRHRRRLLRRRLHHGLQERLRVYVVVRVGPLLPKKQVLLEEQVRWLNWLAQFLE